MAQVKITFKDTGGVDSNSVVGAVFDETDGQAIGVTAAPGWNFNGDSGDLYKLKLEFQCQASNATITLGIAGGSFGNDCTVVNSDGSLPEPGTTAVSADKKTLTINIQSPGLVPQCVATAYLTAT